MALRFSEEKARASYDDRTRIARDLHDDIGQRVISPSVLSKTTRLADFRF